MRLTVESEESVGFSFGDGAQGPGSESGGEVPSLIHQAGELRLSETPVVRGVGGGGALRLRGRESINRGDGGRGIEDSRINFMCGWISIHNKNNK